MPDLTETERPREGGRRNAAAAAALVVVLTISIQTGSALAVRVIDSVGVFEALWLRTAFAALLLVAIRPSALRRLPPKGHRLPLAALGGDPLPDEPELLRGDQPRARSASSSPSSSSGRWAWPSSARGASSTGCGSCWPAWASSCSPARRARRPASALLFALSAGVCWGVYLLLAKRAVTGMDPLSVTALMMLGATVLATPLLAIDGVKLAGHWDAVALGLVIAVVSSAFPYWLEMVAIRRVRAATYGVLLSIEPAVAALAALVVLGQRISPLEAAAMAAVMAAAAGASWTSGGAAEAGVDLPAP